MDLSAIFRKEKSTNIEPQVTQFLGPYKFQFFNFKGISHSEEEKMCYCAK